MTYQQIRSAYEKKGYKFYSQGAYNLNIFGIRSRDRTADMFNDILGIAYKDEFNREQCLLFKGTTDPGAYFLSGKMGNSNGTAILIPNQYKSAWKIGNHKTYEALRQSEKAQFRVWRDNDKDGKLDLKGKVYNDVSGLNFHTTSFINQTARIGAYSAGCQVVQNDKDFNIAMSIIKRSAELYGDYFTYTLFDEITM